MQYIKTYWKTEYEKKEELPVLLFYEVDENEERYGTRYIEVFSDRSIRCFGENEEFVTEAPVPIVSEINKVCDKTDKFSAFNITKEEFEEVWRQHSEYNGYLDFPEYTIDFGKGIVQVLSDEEKEYGALIKVRWKGGIKLKLANRWNFYWITVSKDDTIFDTIRIKNKTKKEELARKFQREACRIEKGEFAGRTSISERVEEIINSRQLTSCMNNTKWQAFKDAMIYDMPFSPPYVMKTLFEDVPEHELSYFLEREAVEYLGDYSAESFAGWNYKIIEWIKVKPSYCKSQGGNLVRETIVYNSEKEFLEILEQYHIPYELENGVYTIYGYK